MTAALIFAGLSLYAAFFLYLCFRDRGRVDRGRIYLVGDGSAVKIIASEETIAGIKRGIPRLAPDTPSLLAPAALWGIPIIADPACGPRTGWDVE